MTARALGALLLLAALPAQAWDYQLHGFAAQGFIASEGNNLYGDSRHGSFEFYEAGLNGSLQLQPRLLASAQVLARDAGATDDEGLRLDYALLDYRVLAQIDGQAGLRLGRVRNPLGFYNDTQDIIFTRPGILLPSSVYINQGFRSLLFSSDGLQLYGDYTLGTHELSLLVGRALNDEANHEEKRQFGGGTAPPNDIRFRELMFSRLQDEWDGGRWRAALSHAHGRITIEPDPAAPFLEADFTANFYVASLRYASRRYSLTGEYALIDLHGSSRFGGRFENQSDGLYLQADWFVRRTWTLMARYDLSFADRDDRDGREYAAATGGDRRSRYARDFTLGARWQPDPHWGVWAEQHWIDGSGTVSALDNPGPTADPHWSAFLLMLGYRF